MKLIIVRHTEKIKILQNDFKVFKDVLKYHLNNIEDFSKEVIKNEEKTCWQILSNQTKNV